MSSSAAAAPKGRPRTTGAAPRPSKGAGKGRSQARPATSEVLRAKEEEYRRMNAELEAKTAALVLQAEEIMQDNLSIASLSLLQQDNLSILSELDSPGNSSLHQATTSDDIQGSFARAPQSSTIKHPMSNVESEKQRPIHRPKTTSSAPAKKKPSNRPTTTASATIATTQLVALKKDSTKAGGASLEHPDLPESIGVDIDRTVQRLERNFERSGGHHGDDILPEVAEDMGPEATIRFLKAKLRVMQEEMDRLCQENSEKDKQLHASESRLKEITEQSSKLQRSHQATVSQIDKYRQTTESLKHKCEGLEAQLVSLRKEVDNMKSTQKKATSNQGALEVRLNRAMEETEKYKTALQKARVDSKDSVKQERQRVDHLVAENKQLEKQKSELISAFKKQMKLIDILKRQKMHVEAAKMLSFTEEEFVKALDWGAS